LIAAIHHSGSGPAWLGILLIAEQWGTPPWKIAGGSPMIWYFRWVEFWNQKQKKYEVDVRKAHT
jgi:hypothetical protein